MDIFYDTDYGLSQQNQETHISVSGSHAWIGDGPSFFIPAAGIVVGRIFSISCCIVRKVLDRARTMLGCRRREVRFVFPGNTMGGRLISRRL